MSLLDRAASAWRALIFGPDLERRDAAGGLVVGGPRSTAVWPNYALDGQVARAYRLAVVQACIDAIARDISAAPLRVYQDVDGQPKEDARHPARLIISEPNPTHSETEFWYFVVAMAATTGFCVIEKVRSGAGRTVELWPLVSPWLKVRPKPQALPDWEYRVPGNDPWPLAAEDVILVTYRPDPWGGWTGRTPMTSLKRELAIDDQMTDFLNLLLERGGVPPIGLRVVPQGSPPMVPKIEQAEADAIVEKFAQKYGGVENWAKPAFLGGLSVERIGLDLGEMLFPQVREHIELHVCTAFGVPAGMVGTAAGLARNTYSNSITDVRKYYDGTIAPLWARLDGAFSRGLLREYDPGKTRFMEFDVSDIEALQEDEAPRWQRATTAIGTGMITLNQAQAEVGLPGFGPAGDVLLIPFSVTPTRPEDLVALAEEAAKPPEAVPPALLPGGDEDEEPDEEEEERQVILASIAHRGDILGEPGGRLRWTRDRSGMAPNLRFLPDQQRASLVATNRRTVKRLARNVAPKLTTYWKEQGTRITVAATRSAVVSQNGRAGSGMLTRDIAEIDWQAEVEELAKVLAPHYALSGQTAFGAVAKQLDVGIDWDLANPNVRRILRELATRITGISATTQDDVRRVVGVALDEGVTMDELASRLKGLFEETYKSRSMNVALTESQVAFNRASVLGFQESNVVAATELADNPKHCDYGGDEDGLECCQRNGLVVPLEQAQVHIEGTHPRCVLACIPVLFRPLGEV